MRLLSQIFQPVITIPKGAKIKNTEITCKSQRVRNTYQYYLLYFDSRLCIICISKAENYILFLPLLHLLFGSIDRDIMSELNAAFRLAKALVKLKKRCINYYFFLFNISFSFLHK